MAKEELIDMVIPEIPVSEKILKEGVAAISNLYYKPHLRFMYKYAITEKGIWTRNPKVMFVKSKSVFMSFSDLDSFMLIEYNKNPCMVFYPKAGKPSTKVFFDDHDGAVEVLDKYLPRSALQDVADAK